MRAVGVVVVDPAGEHDPSLGERVELLAVGGFICARSTQGQPLVSHLTAVGLLLWASGLANVAIGWITFWEWLPQPILIALCLAFGAWMSSLLKGGQKD